MSFSARRLRESLQEAFADPLLRRGFLGLAIVLPGLLILMLFGVLLIGWSAMPIFFIPISVCLLLAWSWRDGRLGFARATRRIWQAAEAGDPDAVFALGLAFERGDRDHPKDPTAARIWYLRAAEAGYMDAAYRLGELLVWGQGGMRDLKGARRWLSQAAAGGHAGAAARLAELAAGEADTDR